MRKLRVMVVDDEPLAREGLALLLQADPEVELVGTESEGASAAAAIQELKPDLVLLDVQMPDANGLEVMGSLPPEERPAVIFITAHAQHAVEAFELSAVDYLLKPFRDERFRAAIARAKDRLAQPEGGIAPARLAEMLMRLQPPSRPDVRLVVKVEDGHQFFALDEITWIEAQGAAVKLCAHGECHVVRESLRAIEQRLDPARFVRVHRSFLVNIRAIRKITPEAYGDHLVHTMDGARIRLSRSHRGKLEALLGSAQR